jgi:hypothetical protein
MMGRMTTAMWWSGLILLFASGLLFGLAVAQAEAVEPVIRCVEVPSGGYWEPATRTVLSSGRVITTDVYRPLTSRTVCAVDEIATQVQAHEHARAEALETMRARVPLDVMQAACAKAHPEDLAAQGQCLVRAKGLR